LQRNVNNIISEVNAKNRKSPKKSEERRKKSEERRKKLKSAHKKTEEQWHLWAIVQNILKDSCKL